MLPAHEGGGDARRKAERVPEAARGRRDQADPLRPRGHPSVPLRQRMIAMPPIEWPASTSGPSGATAAITAARSSASWSMVIEAGSTAAERPCPRWS